MIPAGYLFKHIAGKPKNLKADHVQDIYSISSCISHDFADYIAWWAHNGFWFFDSPLIMEQLAEREGLDLGDATLFYYEAFGQEFDDAAHLWRDFSPEPSLTTAVREPVLKTLCGYDVVTFRAGTNPECSPLSCNGLAEQIPTNDHCLFADLPSVRQALEQGAFNGAEEGPYRIFAVYTVAAE